MSSQTDLHLTLHQRSAASSGEYIKALTSLSVGSLAVFFLALTAKIEPTLTDYQKNLLMHALSMMSLSTLSGVLNWLADAQWAYAWGKEIDPTESEEKKKGWSKQKDHWHIVKSMTRITITTFFLSGVIAAAGYIFSRLAD